MGANLEELRVFRRAEEISDRIWETVVQLESFQRGTLGEQLVRSANSVGANIAEGYGRFHYGEKIRFFYFARGSVSETKYWLRRANQRKMISPELHVDLLQSLERIGSEINRFVSSLRRQQRDSNVSG